MAHTEGLVSYTNKIKMWIRKRQAAFIQQVKNSIAYRLWRNKVNSKVPLLYRVAKVEQVNPAKWRREIKKLTGEAGRQTGLALSVP